MSDKINSELNSEEILNSAAEDTEKTVAADDEEITVLADNDTERTILADEPSQEEESDDTEQTVDAKNTVDAEDTDAISSASEEVKPAKKNSVLQVPVIIACCIVVLALVGFLAYMAFFLKEPENVTWSNEIDDTTYYYEFKSDGTFKGYLGSIEVSGSFQKANGEDGKTISVDKTFGNFYQNMPGTYSITGSRLFGNQELTCSYSDEYEFTLTQSKREKNLLDLPEDFTPDEELIGSWIFKYMGYDIYKVTFNKNGSMVLDFVQDGVTYNGIYTLEDSKINFTYYVTESTAVPIDYTVDGDNMTFMGYNFVREGSDAEKATSDQQLLVPQTTQAVEEDTAAEGE